MQRSIKAPRFCSSSLPIAPTFRRHGSNSFLGVREQQGHLVESVAPPLLFQAFEIPQQHRPHPNPKAATLAWLRKVGRCQKSARAEEFFGHSKFPRIGLTRS